MLWVCRTYRYIASFYYGKYKLHLGLIKTDTGIPLVYQRNKISYNHVGWSAFGYKFATMILRENEILPGFLLSLYTLQTQKANVIILYRRYFQQQSKSFCIVALSITRANPSQNFKLPTQKQSCKSSLAHFCFYCKLLDLKVTYPVGVQGEYSRTNSLFCSLQILL